MTARMHQLAVIVCDIEDCKAYWIRTQGHSIDDAAQDGWTTEVRGGAYMDFCPEHISDVSGYTPNVSSFRSTVYYADAEA